MIAKAFKVRHLFWTRVILSLLLSGLLVPPKWAFKFSLNFTINPDYENISFVDDEDVQVSLTSHVMIT